MNSYTIELNSICRDNYDSPELSRLNKNSKIVEVFSAMTGGKSLDKFDSKVANACTAKIKELAQRAISGDNKAISEINTIRKYSIEPELMAEIELLGVFGDYENVGFNDTIEREVISNEGELSRIQAGGGDVVKGFNVSQKYAVTSETISAGYAVDYRKIQHGDMSAENRLKENIKRDMLNKASKYAVVKVYNAVKNATGIKNFSETNGITKTALDTTLNFVRKFGIPNIFGDYSAVSQINDLVPYTSNLNTSYMNISQEAMEEIRKTGLLSVYNGSLIYAIQNAFDTSQRTADGKSFKTITPEGLIFVTPTGIESPVKLWTRGSLTSLTGNDISTGKLITRYDLEVAVDVAKGLEYKIGVLRDTNYTID